MSQPIAIRDDLYEKLKAIKQTDKQSFSGVIDNLLNNHNNLQEANINKEGRFPGSSALTGKTILYKVKI